MSGRAAYSALASLDDSRYDRLGASWLAERLGSEVLLMQGPMGTELMRQTGGEDVPAAYWNVADPQEVIRLHSLYRAVGADLMLTNTFQASAPALQRDEVDAPMERVNELAVECARRAGAPCVVGSIGPCGLTWDQADTPEYRAVRAAYREQAHALLDAGAHALMLETFTSLHDAEPALVGALDVACGMPVLMSFAVDEVCNLYGDGASIEDACRLAAKMGASSVGVNCCSLAAATEAVGRMVAVTSLPVSVRPNAGDPRRNEDGELVWPVGADEFVEACTRWVHDGATIVAPCCGGDPLTVCALAGYLEESVR